MRFATVRIMTALALAPALVVATAQPAPAKNNTGAVIGGLIAGAAIGAAVSAAVDHPKTVRTPKPPPPPPRSPWSNPYHPKQGVSCYPVQQACYNKNGAYNGNWTWKVYAR